MILETIIVGPMEVNCYLLASDKNSSAIIIDPGDEERKIRVVLEKFNLKPALIINTHGHYDHIGCDDKFGVPVYVHAKDKPLLTNAQLNLSGLFAIPYDVKSEIRTLEDNQELSLAGIQLKVFHIPGHTPGGVALLVQERVEKILFSGDSLFFQGIGRTDLQDGNGGLLIKSIKDKLFSLPDDTVVYPGHGPSTTIGAEKRSNPFFRPGHPPKQE